MCLERADKGCIKGSVSDIRKAKSLVGRWLKRPSTSETSGNTDNNSVEIVIERDTVVSAHVKVGRGSSSVKVLEQYRVLDIHDKYYNKWFMAKVLQKVFGKDFKHKLTVRMQEVGAVQECSDGNLDDSTYKRAPINRLLGDDEAKDVVRKLKRV